MPPESTPLRLMAILAHPDDESLGLGGVLARYAGEGIETTIITATRGESGRFRGESRGGPNHPGPDALARIREVELRNAARVLGAREPILLGYRDAALAEADPREAASRIAAHLRAVRPHVVLTFAPDGAYGHPDHIAVSQLATAAIMTAADPRGLAGGPQAGEPHAVAKLYYIAWPTGPWDAYQSAFKKLVSVVDGVERQAQPWPDWAITTVIDTRAQWETTWEAVSCHASQIASYQRLKELSPQEHEALWGRQYFYRAFSTVNGGRSRETDLFEGLRS